MRPFHLCALAVLPLAFSAEAQEPSSPAVSIFSHDEKDPAFTSKRRHTMSESEFAAWLEWLPKRFASPADRLVRVADQTVGAAYQDNSRMFSRTEYDCVTFVEQALATALAPTWDDYYRLVARLRYAGGNIPFARSQFEIVEGKIRPAAGIDEIQSIRNRNTFIIAEWNRNNVWCLEDITKNLGKSAIKPWIPLHHIVRAQAFYAKQGLALDLPDQKVIDAFIPREAIPEILRELRSGDLVEIIVGSLENRYCDHMGILIIDPRWNDPTGDTLYMIHAVPPKVRREVLTRFLRKFPDVQGLKFLRLRENAQEAAGRESQMMDARMRVPVPQN